MWIDPTFSFCEIGVFLQLYENSDHEECQKATTINKSNKNICEAPRKIHRHVCGTSIASKSKGDTLHDSSSNSGKRKQTNVGSTNCPPRNHYQKPHPKERYQEYLVLVHSKQFPLDTCPMDTLCRCVRGHD